MLHGRVMPPRDFGREGALGARKSALVAGVLALLLGVGAARAEDAGPPLLRVASINLCTDQLLVAVADPGQVAGLSPYFRDEARSWAASRVPSSVPVLSGGAEDVLVLKPDLVLAGRFTRRATRELLRAKGLRVEEFDVARSLDDARRQIRRMGDLLGQPGRAEAEVAAIDAAAARARLAAATQRLTVLPLQRRGWVSGQDSLMTSLLAEAGLANAAAGLGVGAGGQVSLEAIVRARPDLLLVSRDDDQAEDQGRAFLLHPALARLYPPGRRIALPERLTVCGGPMLAEALDHLTRAVERLPPQPPQP